MPGDGRLSERQRTSLEQEALIEGDENLLGDRVVDVYLNERTVWSGVPLAAWYYKIGGYQVLRKWLAYREDAILGRAIAASEAR